MPISKANSAGLVLFLVALSSTESGGGGANFAAAESSGHEEKENAVHLDPESPPAPAAPALDVEEVDYAEADEGGVDETTTEEGADGTDVDADTGFAEGTIDEEEETDEVEDLSALLAMDMDGDLIDVGAEDGVDADNRKKKSKTGGGSGMKSKTMKGTKSKFKMGKSKGFKGTKGSLRKSSKKSGKGGDGGDQGGGATTVPATSMPTFMPTMAPTSCKCNIETCGCPQINFQDYRGDLSVTRSGIPCQGWADQVPHVHDFTPMNFPNSGLNSTASCRNPDGNPDGLWCFTSDPNVQWDFCDAAAVSSCGDECCLDGCESSVLTCGCANVKQADFRGDAQQTARGEPCVDWSLADIIEFPEAGLTRNFCRNPDDSAGGAWCFTADNWGYCKIETCDLEC